MQWILGEGYSSARSNSYPYRTLESGRRGGLSILLHAYSRNLEYLCSGSIEGFQVTLHNPWEFPRMSKNSFFVPLGSVVEAAVTPNIMLTNDDLRRRYSPAQRQCYFSEERRLRFFKHYTRSNCEFECLANVTFHMCQCVAFHMPRELDTLICTDLNDNCVYKAEYMFQLLRSGMKDDLNIFNVSEDKMEALGFKCNCLQTCLSVKYRSERSTTDTNVKEHLIESTKNLPPDKKAEIEEKIKFSLLLIFFKESQFLPLRRMELQGIGTFIANCGGLLGLCLGMSFLSILELLYWLLVRPFRRSKKVAPPPVKIMTLTLPALYKKKEHQ
ncbi:hypothetical protein R5R35_001594 [Gryllus longicercus]|uniref:Pickpocket n=1 Tax=Gryllus longicercus TaxID=2509291 RepID=A0AAN9W5P4_9ORTH